MLPDFIIIGAMKCGTTSLHYYLNLHPEISIAERIETLFFCDPGNWHKGVEWYERLFNGNGKIRGERSPNYTKFPIYSGVPERMYSILPHAKLIYMVRDPIDRIISHYVHQVSSRRENRSIDETLKDPDSQKLYVPLSKFFMQLQQFLNFYQKSDILIVALEDLRDHRPETMRRILQFLQVDDSFYSDNYSKVLHKSTNKRKKNLIGRLLHKRQLSNRIRPLLPKYLFKTYKSVSGKGIERPTLNEELKSEIVKQLKDDVSEFRKVTGQDFGKWSI